MNRPYSLERDDLLGLDSPPSPPALVPVRSRERSSRSRPSSITSDASRHAGSYWSRNSAPVVLLPTNAATYRPPSISSPPIPTERERSRGRPPIPIASAVPPLPPTPIDVYSRPESPVRLRSRSRNRRRRYRDGFSESNEEDYYFRIREDQGLDYDRAFSRHRDYDLPLSRPRRRSTRRDYDDRTRSPSPPLSERALRRSNRSRASYTFEDEDNQKAELGRREREHIHRARTRERDLEVLYEQQIELLKQMKSKVENQKVVEPSTEGNDPETEKRAEVEGSERRSVRFDVSSKEANRPVVSDVNDKQGSISGQSPSLPKDETSIEKEIESLRQQIDQVRASENVSDYQASLEGRIRDERGRGLRESDHERSPRVEEMQRRLRDEAEIAQLEREQILLKELHQLKTEFRQKDKANSPAIEPTSPQQEEQEARDKDGSFEHRVKEKFLVAGFTEEETQRILSSKQDSNAKPTTEESDDSKKRYVKVHRKYLLPETLEVYHLPWEWAKSDSNYIIIKKFVERDLMDELFQHTKDVKDRQAATGKVQAGEDRETLYIVRKKTDPSRSRRLRSKTFRDIVRVAGSDPLTRS